jgi:hypothetical protein
VVMDEGDNLHLRLALGVEQGDSTKSNSSFNVETADWKNVSDSRHSNHDFQNRMRGYGEMRKFWMSMRRTAECFVRPLL